MCCSLVRWRCARSACSPHSIAKRRARKHDVGADREPKGVVADDRYLDEYAKDRKDDDTERSHKPKVHCAYLPGYDAQNPASMITHGNVRDLTASSTPRVRYVARHSQCVCSLDCGARVTPECQPQAIARCL